MKIDVDDRKYAIVAWALSHSARGTLLCPMEGELDEVRAVLDSTSLKKLAERFGYTESELAVDRVDFLSADELFIRRS